MHINWAALGEVFVVSFAVTVGVALLFTGGVLALSARAARQEREASSVVQQAVSGLCFTACAGIVLYGVYLIVAS